MRTFRRRRPTRVHPARASLILKVASRRRTRVVTGSWPRLRKMERRRSSPRKRPRQTGATQKTSPKRNLASRKPKLNQRTTRTMRWTSTTTSQSQSRKRNPRPRRAVTTGQRKRNKRRLPDLFHSCLCCSSSISFLALVIRTLVPAIYIIFVEYSRHEHDPRLRQVAV